MFVQMFKIYLFYFSKNTFVVGLGKEHFLTEHCHNPLTIITYYPTRS